MDHPSDRYHPVRPPASEQSTGSDRTGAVTVQVDDEGRVLRVTMRSLSDELRRASALVAAFKQALAAAQSAGRPEPEPAPAGQPLTARRVVMPERRSLHDIVRAIPEERLGHPVGSADLPGAMQGRSANQCVIVRLDPAGAGGEITVDQGWLSHAEATNIARAFGEAFANAYQKREAR